MDSINENDFTKVLIENGYDANDFKIIVTRSGRRIPHATVHIIYHVTRVSNKISYEYEYEYNDDCMSMFIDDLLSLKYGDP